jgi:hypothetical protein
VSVTVIFVVVISEKQSKEKAQEMKQKLPAQEPPAHCGIIMPRHAAMPPCRIHRN